ncbi:hypothetical protein QBC33DRAFT_516184 [Phialemonium atrogriseum]|uniref:Uncharacterized protein n=1 Tax=Phialemonium atrogriseum TaxID=1093897 RepID=A0AAJ0BXG1_9PEZI|nr:uncharacterized protein QBC33DRAFT_516184 [Phialemonium atrogriseum]KAK1766283.1 hypothetical protein QBC33DRAFT_516184 [Phialemonium atrogriseum]
MSRRAPTRWCREALLKPSRPHAEAGETAVVGDTCRIQVTKLAWQAPTDNFSTPKDSNVCDGHREFSKFKSAHLTVRGGLEPTRIPWAETNPGMHCRSPDAMGLLALLRKDRFCSRCLRVSQLKRKHKQFRSLVDKKLYCDGCKTKHPAGLFSATQRRMNWSWWKGSTRVCIAHEGYIRACQHVMIRWSDIESWGAQNGLHDTGEAQFLIPWTNTKRSYMVRNRLDRPRRNSVKDIGSANGRDDAPNRRKHSPGRRTIPGPPTIIWRLLTTHGCRRS